MLLGVNQVPQSAISFNFSELSITCQHLDFLTWPSRFDESTGNSNCVQNLFSFDL